LEEEIMKKLWLVFCFFAVSLVSIYPSGKADDVLKQASKTTIKAAGKKADDAISYAARHVDDWGKAVSFKLDDLTRVLSHKADDIARIGLQKGDDIIYDFSKVHSKIAKTVSTKTDNIARTTFRLRKYTKFTDNASETLNGPLKRNTIYRQLDADHKYFSATDSTGRVSEVYAPELKLKTHNNRLDHTPIDGLKEQGYSAFKDDEAGHIIADFVGGSRHYDNIVPMSRELNRGKWREMEREIEDYLNAGKKVEHFHVKIDYSPNNRPSRFTVEYVLDGVPVRPKIMPNTPFSKTAVSSGKLSERRRSSVVAFC
jgi:hypothetical protein